MNEQEYLLAWSCYIAAALGLLLACFALTRWMWRYLREPLRVAVCVLLFSPTIMEQTQGQLAPSLAIVALDLVNLGDHSANALWSLQICALFAAAFYLVWVLLRLFWQNLRTAPVSRSQGKHHRPARREIPEERKKKISPGHGSARRIEPNL